MKKISLIALLSGLLSLPVLADFQDKVSGSDNSSGCGYGWEVTKGRTLSASSTRASTNSTASNTIAMTMGTSGCEKHDIVLKDREQEYFVELNYENIVAEMAEGQGEYLTSFAQVMGCADSNTFGVVAQSKLAELAGQNAMGMLRNVRTEMTSNPSLKAACL